jgi:ankyrin repeat protein
MGTTRWVARETSIRLFITSLQRLLQRGYTALMAAAELGSVLVIQVLFRAGAAVNIRDQVGWSGVVVRRFVDIVPPKQDGKSALFYALKPGHEAVVKELLARGARVDIADKVRL